MNNKLFYIINEDGMRDDARILSKFRLSNGEDYITYTYDEYNEDGMIKIYVTGIEGEKGNYSYKEITSDEEWNNIKTILKTLAKSEEEPFPETIKSDITIIGEEVSVRRPKKLLVSSKFADVLESKYSEETVEETKEEITPEFDFEEKKEPVKEEINLEKTIKIPTFEELQARNKNIQAVMENAKEEPKVEPVRVELEKEEPAFESKTRKVDYEEQFKKSVEPVLLDVYAKQQKHIEELEEELSKTKFDLFEKQKEALSLNNEKEEFKKKNEELEEQLTGVQKKMDGILNVLQDK